MASGVGAWTAGSEDIAAKSRHYVNPFSDFDTHVKNCFIEEHDGTYKMSHAFESQIKERVDSLLSTITRNQKNINDSGFSVYTGMAGVAMLLLFASKRINEELRQPAKFLINEACKSLHKSRVNFLNGNSGVLVLNAMINDTAEAHEYLHQSLGEMKRLVKNPTSDIPDELLYGRVGFLYSQLFMKQNKIPSACKDSDITEVINIIIDSGRALAAREKSKAPLKFKWHDKNYYGAAHGTSGILYLLLQAREYISRDHLVKYIKPTIDNLLENRFQSGNLASSEGSSSDRLVQWCHGAPGAVQLFCLAYEVFDEQRYLKAAILSGEIVWQRGLLRKGCGLCHGTAGNAYTFLSLYQLLKSRKEFTEVEAAKYLYRACAFAEWCFDWERHQERKADRYYSLYEGLAGTTYFLIDLLRPMEAAFPGYTVHCI